MTVGTNYSWSFPLGNSSGLARPIVMVLSPAARYTSIPPSRKDYESRAGRDKSEISGGGDSITLIRMSVIVAVLVWTYYFTANAPRNTAFGVPRPFSGPGSRNKRSGWSTWSI